IIAGSAAGIITRTAVASVLPSEAAAAGMQEPSAVSSADPVASSQSQQLLDAASESYKHLKFIQYDGVTPDELYPEAMKVYQNVMAAITDPMMPVGEMSRFRGILTDISPLLLQGALHYSSAGDSGKMADFASSFVDIRMRPDMKGVPMPSDAAGLYPALVYSAASSAYNRGDYPKAIDYFEEYLSTDAKDRREQVYTFMAQACINAECPERGVDRLVSAVNLYPSNVNLLMLTIQCCLDGNCFDVMQPLLDKGLALKPDDPQLLNLQGRLYENEGDFSSALDVYSRLDELMPDNMAVNRHLALCYYNLGAAYYNKSLMESDDKQSKRFSRQSTAYLNTAVDRLNTVVENDPTNVKYLRALAFTYGCLGRGDRLDYVNTRLSALGEPTLTMNSMPESIVFADRTVTSDNRSTSGHVPDFQEFAGVFVEKKLAKWAEKQEFEKLEDYQKRVNQESVYNRYTELCKEAEADYLKKYASRLSISDLKLQRYDTDNETYLIESGMGEIVLPVPLKNKEAETFKNSWNTIQIRNPRYYIRDNHVAIAAVDFVTSAGKSYSYNSANARDYQGAKVTIDPAAFIPQATPSANIGSGGHDKNSPMVVRAASDVDRDIPITSRKAENTVALIIANENYKNVSDVTAALNDGETFAKYCQQTLGIPAGNVMLYENSTYAEMVGAMLKLKQFVNALGDGVDVIVYYAGHGFPDEASKDAYLLPVDGDGYTTAVSYPLKKFYSELSDMRADNVMVFLDACFSGATRGGGMLAEARGVALKPREASPEGNMFVLSAASDQETALPYKEKNHGLFTYFLLKKLQDSKGNVTLHDLSRYVEDNVKKNSISVNGKLQTPSTKVSGRLADEWKNKKLRP
ncbi:MAG: caspase family protein, partial [Muribaculaceae bacterium]|nr:caspase family protein [Muribaculaceae bacterium]